VRAVLLRVCEIQLVLAYTPTPEIQPSIMVLALENGRMPTSLPSSEAGAASGFMQLREITGKRMIITHLSNHTLGVIITVHDISHLGVKITSL